MSEQPSRWQQSIEGEWYGLPAVFDQDGTKVGYCKVSRSSVFDGGETTYYMHTRYRDCGPLQARLEVEEFAFKLLDGDKNRVYLGPDFIGAGHPYGAMVDAHYYSPAWQADLRTMVHILPDMQTQVYSSLLYEGPRIAFVFNGVYLNAHDYDTNPTTKARIDEHLASEEARGPNSHVLPPKAKGRWRGSMEVFAGDQSPLGKVDVQIAHRPLTLLRAEQTVEISGEFERAYRFERFRDANRHTYDGPDVWGNAFSYGRALYTSQHLFGQAKKVKGREFLFDDALSISAVWYHYDGDHVEYVTFGVLSWEADE